MIERIDLIKAGDLSGVRIVGAELGTCPSFLHAIVRGEEEDFGVGMSGIARGSLRRSGEQDGCAGLCPAGEVEEVVILPKAVEIVGTFGLHGREEKNDAGSDFSCESLSPRAVVGVGLTVESVEGRESGQDEKKRGELFFHLCLPGRIDWKQLCARRELVLRRQVRFSG